jgi:hypothetical protein
MGKITRLRLKPHQQTLPNSALEGVEDLELAVLLGSGKKKRIDPMPPKTGLQSKGRKGTE